MKVEPSIGRRLLHNTLFNFLGRLWITGANLLLTPMLLSYLGQDRFAIWAIFWALTQYFALLDLGLGPSLIKHFAQFQAKGDIRSINQAVTTVFYSYLAAGGVLVVLLWPGATWLATGLSLPEGLRPEAQVTFHAGLVILVLMYLLSPFDALLKGLQRMDLTNLTMMVLAIVNVAGTYLVLSHGWGLPGLMAMTAGIYFLQGVIFIFLCKKIVPALSVGPSWFFFEIFQRMLGYGSRLQVSRIAEMISYQADKVLLGFLTPIRYVTFYDLGAKVATTVHDLPVVLLTAVLPAVSQLAEQKDDRRLWLLYERGTKYLLLLSVPILAGIWLTAHLVLKAWLGHASDEVYQAVLFLVTGYCISINTGMITTVGIGIGWLTPIVRAGLLQCALNLVLSIILILSLGYLGALIATLAALALSNLYLLIRFYRDFHRSLQGYFASVAQVFLLNVAPVLLSVCYLTWVSQWTTRGGRGTAFMALLGCMGLYIAVYLASIRWYGVFDSQDRDLLSDHLPMMRWLTVRTS